MKRKRDNRPAPFLRLALVLFALTLISVWSVGGLMAKYISSDTEQKQARVGSFVLRVSKDGAASSALRLDGIEKPGDTATYAFKVTNSYTAGQVSEVDEVYTLSVRVNGDLPLTFTLGRPTGGDLTQNLDSGAHDVTDDTGEANRRFLATVEANKEYTLMAAWPLTAAAMDPVYASDAAAAYCLLTVSGAQTD